MLVEIRCCDFCGKYSGNISSCIVCGKDTCVACGPFRRIINNFICKDCLVLAENIKDDIVNLIKGEL